MGRTILADKRIGQVIDSFGVVDTWVIGLLIGQRSEAKDYAVHLVRTPVIDEGGKDVSKIKKLEHVDEHWVAVHCRQVLCMLPGGLGVLGIFVVAPPDAMKLAHNKLPQVLAAVHKTVHQFHSQTLPIDEISEGILLQICSLTKKLTCRSYDLADSKAGAKPADWKIQNNQETWIQLETKMVFNVDFAIPKEKMSSTLMKQIQNGLMPSYQNLRNAVATIDSSFVDGDALMETYFGGTGGSTKKKGKKQQPTNQEKMKLDVELYTTLLSNANIQGPKVENCCATMSLRGTMSGRAFVHPKMTADTAVKAIKQDILRSIKSRIEMLCEEMLQTEEEQDEHILYEMPVRVFCNLSESTLSFCDYMLQDEGIDDSLERFRDIAGLVGANDESLETDIERVPTEEELFDEPKNSDALLGKFSEKESSARTKAKGLIRLAVGGIVGALAVAVSYMYIGQE